MVPWFLCFPCVSWLTRYAEAHRRSAELHSPAEVLNNRLFIQDSMPLCWRVISQLSIEQLVMPALFFVSLSNWWREGVNSPHNANPGEVQDQVQACLLEGSCSRVSAHQHRGDVSSGWAHVEALKRTTQCHLSNTWPHVQSKLRM